MEELTAGELETRRESARGRLLRSTFVQVSESFLEGLTSDAVRSLLTSDGLVPHDFCAQLLGSLQSQLREAFVSEFDSILDSEHILQQLMELDASDAVKQTELELPLPKQYSISSSPSREAAEASAASGDGLESLERKRRTAEELREELQRTTEELETVRNRARELNESYLSSKYSIEEALSSLGGSE